MIRRLFVAAGELGGDLGALRRVVGQLDYQGNARGLYEHHGVRVEQSVRGVSIDLKDVVIKPEASLGSLASRSDLREGGGEECTLYQVRACGHKGEEHYMPAAAETTFEAYKSVKYEIFC